MAEDALKMLSDRDASTRLNGVANLVELGDAASSIVGSVSKLLSNEDTGVRVAAAAALAAIGPSAASEMAELEKLLDDAGEDAAMRILSISGIRSLPPASQRKVNCAAAAALGSMGPKAGGTAGKLAGHLTSKDYEMRVECATALGKLGTSSGKFENQLVGLLDDTHPFVVAAACTALGNIAATTQAVDANVAKRLSECILSDHACVQVGSLGAVGKLGEDASLFVDDVAKAVSSPLAIVRVAAIEALPGCGDVGQMYAAEVCRRLSDNDCRVRAASAMALPKLGSRGEAFVDEVVAGLEDEEADVRIATVKGLGCYQQAVLSEYVGVLESITYWDPAFEVQQAAKMVLATAA